MQSILFPFCKVASGTKLVNTESLLWGEIEMVRYLQASSHNMSSFCVCMCKKTLTYIVDSLTFNSEPDNDNVDCQTTTNVDFRIKNQL
jgi:hypothetical protein